MNSKKIDVLIIYTNFDAKSAADTSYQGTCPFPVDSSKTSYNIAYSCFLQTCQEFGLTAAFSTPEDIIGAGKCSSYWIYKNNSWQKVLRPVYAPQIFMKFSSTDKFGKEQKQLLFSSPEVRPFSGAAVRELFSDKQKTYDQLKEFAIPTETVTNLTDSSIDQHINNLSILISQHPHKKDFSSSLILKDRFGAGGNDVYKIKENFDQEISDLLLSNKETSFILQPMVNFKNGYTYNGTAAATDIRLIFHKEKIIQTYIRRAKADDFRCNENQGGTSSYITVDEIPTKVLSAAKKIVTSLKDKKSLYALDFIISDHGNVYFLEGNIGPGLCWNPAHKKDERMSKELITHIVEELALRAQNL